jgi:glycosyltransferase involved in cell wall biosynthesis
VNRSPEDIIAQTAVLIPSYNAARELGGVIEKVARIVPRERIIVVDDGSTDNTADIARGAGVVLHQHPHNMGKGAALVSGAATASDMNMEFVITLDADAQHDPEEIPKFVEKQAGTDADIIVGNRMSDRRNMPPDRVFANRLTSWFVSLSARCSIPDSQNGYRMIRTSVFEELSFETTRYETESEILIRAGRAGARIESVPIRTIYGTEISKVNPVIDTLRFFRLVFKSLFW